MNKIRFVIEVVDKAIAVASVFRLNLIVFITFGRWF
jgi:hypothetical protein